MEPKYRHLKIDLPRASRRSLKYGGITYPIKKFLVSNRLTSRLLRRAGAELEELARLQNLHLKTFELLKRESAGAAAFGSGYGYLDDLQELKVALKYKKQLEDGRQDTQAESGTFYRHAEEVLGTLFRADPNIRELVNFGVGYAHVDGILASKFPAVTFVGIDRSRFTKFLNEDDFRDRENMEFVAGDIFQLLEKRDFAGGVFFTARTLLLLPKSFIDRLYAAVHRAKFRYIVGLEQLGISRQTGQAYEFSDDEQASVVFRDTMFIHNWPGIVKNADFTMARSELVKSQHPHEDFRILSFTAVRRGGD